MRARPAITALSIALTLASLLFLPAGSRDAQAAPRFDYLFNPASVINDHQLFLNLAVGNFGMPRPALEPMLPRMRSVETDLPVYLFLARESGQPLETIVEFRSSGMSWSVIATRVNVAPDVFFSGIDRDPGPPYGLAWGHWKKNRRQVRLSDSDITGLVQIQIGHRVAGPSPFELAHACGHTTVVRYVADKKGRGYRDERRGHGEGHGKDHGKMAHKDHDHHDKHD